MAPGRPVMPLVTTAPQRATHGFRSFARITNGGIIYEDYRARGGRRVDLAWDVARKRVKVS